MFFKTLPNVGNFRNAHMNAEIIYCDKCYLPAVC